MPYRVAILVSLILLASLPFLGGSNGEFIGDDVAIIQVHRGLQAGASPLRLFTETYWRGLGAGGLYRPLTMLSFAVDRMVWGSAPSGAPSPAGAHRTNLVLNAVAALLVYWTLRRRDADPASAWLGAALFAVHPVHTEAVVHLIGRADLLTAVFFLAGLNLHGMGGRKARSAAVLCFGAALLSKEMGATLPAVLFAEAWLSRPPGRFSTFLKQQLRTLMPYGIILLIFLLVRGAVLGASLAPPRAWILAVPGRFLAFVDPAPLEVPLTMLHVFGEYLLLLLVPLWLCADYSGFPHSTAANLPVLLSLASWAAIVALTVWAWRRGASKPAVWLSFFALTMLPVSNLIVMSGILMAERVLYLPSVAVVAVAAWAFDSLRKRHVAWVTVFLAWLGVFVVLSALRSPVWSSPLTLYEATVERGRYSGHIALNGVVGSYLRELEKRPDPELRQRALAYARRAVEAYLNHQNIVHLARLLEQDGQLEDSLRWWEFMRRQRPTHARYRSEVIRHLEELLRHSRQSGAPSVARDWAKRLRALDPDHPLAGEVLD